MDVRRVALTVCVLLTVAVSAPSAVIEWQGGDDWWSAANWTVDGVPDQEIDSATPATFTNDQFTFASGSVQRNGRIEIKGAAGSFRLSGGTMSITGQNNSSALNIQTGAAFVVDGTGQLVLAVNTFGNRTFGGDEGSFTIAEDGVLTVESQLQITDGFHFLMQGNADVTADHVKHATSASATSLFTLEGGTLTLLSDNPLQTPSLGSSSPGNRFNFTGEAGSASIVHTNATLAGKTLADKMATGFLAIDGTVVKDTTTVVNGRWFDLTAVGDTQTVTLVPEPTSLALLGLPALGALLRRRRKPALLRAPR